MTFKFIADCEFDAKDLDDAFRRLACHFLFLEGDMAEESDELQFTGKMELVKK